LSESPAAEAAEQTGGKSDEIAVHTKNAVRCRRETGYCTVSLDLKHGRH
jgi:hypothetical protein